MLPIIVLFIIAAMRTVTLTGIETFLSVHLADQGYSDQGRSLVLALFIFAGVYGYFVKWVAYESRQHLSFVIGIASRCPTTALLVVTH